MDEPKKRFKPTMVSSNSGVDAFSNQWFLQASTAPMYMFFHAQGAIVGHNSGSRYGVLHPFTSCNLQDTRQSSRYFLS